MKFFYTVLLILFSFTLSAQHITAKQIPFFKQLPSNEIWDICQDKDGYLWICTTNGLARYDGYDIKSFRSDHRKPELLSDNSIACITDNGTYIWIATQKGVDLYDKMTCRIMPFPDPLLRNKHINAMTADSYGVTWIAAEGKIYSASADLSTLREYSLMGHEGNDIRTINSLYTDKNGTLWVLANGSGPLKYDIHSDSFIAYPCFGESNTAFVMYQDNAGNYRIGTWGDGLWQFYPERTENGYYRRLSVINDKTKSEEPIFYSITQDDMFGYIWALSYNQLYAFSIEENGNLKQVDLGDIVDTHMMYTRIFKDRNGNLWLSSYDMAYTVFFDDSGIETCNLSDIKEKLGWDANLLNMCRDEDNMIWLNQDRYGLCLYDPEYDKILFPQNNSDTFEASLMINSVFNKGIWLCRRNSPEILRLSQKDVKINIEESVRIDRYVSSYGQIQQIEEDSKGNLWILTSEKLLFKPEGEQIIKDVTDESVRMTCMAEDSQGNMFFVSDDGIVYGILSAEENIKPGRTEMQISLKDKEEIRFAGTDNNGVFNMISNLGNVYRSSDTGFVNITVLEKEVEDCSVLSLIAEGDMLWIITNKKIICYDSAKEILNKYSTVDSNISVNIFRNKAVFSDGNGGLYAGGHGGFVYIRPDAGVISENNEYDIAVTDICIDGNSLFFGEKIPESGSTVNKVRLSPDARNIEIFFSSLQYSLIGGPRIAYRLEGIDKEWIYADAEKNSAFYNRIDKGSYTLLMKTELGSGKWSEPQIMMIIDKAPAFYETIYAFLLYLILIVGTGFFVIRIYVKKNAEKSDRKFREELTRIKLDYFTNVSHDLLTPLTIISATAEQIDILTKENKKHSVILRSNVEKLKRLIQQILDFRKIDMGNMILKASYGDIKEFVFEICYTGFRQLAEKKNIDLRIKAGSAMINGYVDFDKLDKIVYNLMSNAVKYTPENKSIDVSLQIIERNSLRFLNIKVEDTGMGIESKDRELIFSRFYNDRKNRGIESNGIGLSLTKELVILHHGTIEVESEIDKGSCFTVEIPIDAASYNEDELAEEIITEDKNEAIYEENTVGENEEKPTILLVDDNMELLFVMKRIFSERFNVLTAGNGRQAKDIFNSSSVDLAIFDVMMPDMNGWELCRQIKDDIRFSHIPIIILTAKKGIDDRVASYEAGADAYIAKPFESKVLLARTGNLLRSFRLRQEAFRKEENVNLEGLSYQSADKQFLQYVIESIEQHIEDGEFDVESLSAELNMSKSTLYRKIKSMTGLTPLELIRNIKMKRACMMLLEKKMNISEIAYAVGFGNPKYFTKCFKEEFSMTPTEYQQKNTL